MTPNQTRIHEIYAGALYCPGIILLLVAAAWLGIVSRTPAQALPDHPHHSCSLEKVLCALRERHDAIIEQEKALLIEARNDIVGGNFILYPVYTRWFSGHLYFYEGGNADGMYDIQDPDGVWTRKYIYGSSAKAEFLSALSTAIQAPPKGPTWKALNQPYPAAGSAASLDLGKIDEILNDAEECVHTLRTPFPSEVPGYVNMRVDVGEGVKSVWEDRPWPLNYYMSWFPTSFNCSRRDRILALAGKVDSLRTFLARGAMFKHRFSTYSEMREQPDPPTQPLALTSGQEYWNGTYVYSGPAHWMGIDGAGGISGDYRDDDWDYANNKPKEPFWRVFQQVGYAITSIKCPVGKIQGRMGFTILSGQPWNHLNNQAMPKQFGSVEAPCNETVWKCFPVSENQMVSLDSTTSGISSLYFDPSGQSITGEMVSSHEGTSLDLILGDRQTENNYPGWRGSIRVRMLIEPNFKYKFERPNFRGNVNEVGQIIFDGDNIRIMAGSASPIETDPVYFLLPVRYKWWQWGDPESIPTNLAHLRNWIVYSESGDQETVYSCRKEDLPEPEWAPNDFPSGTDWPSYYYYIYNRSIIRQILTRTTLVDIKKVSEHKYSLDIYRAPQAPNKDAVSGVYQVSGAPLKTITIENPGNAFTNLGQVALNSGNLSYTLDQQANANTDWQIKKSGATLFRRETDVTNWTTRYTIDGKEGEWLTGVSDSSLGSQDYDPYFIQSIPDIGPTYLKFDEADFEYCRDIRYITMDWIGRSDYLRVGSYKLERVPSTTVAGLLTTTETRSGQTVGKRWEVRPNLHEEQSVVATNLYASDPADSSNLVTVSHVDDGSGLNPFALKSIEHPDGTITTFEYTTGTDWQGIDRDYVTETSGRMPYAPDTRQLVTTYSKKGVIVGTKLKTIGGVTLDSALAEAEDPTYGYPTRVKYFDGATTKATWVDGILTEFEDRLLKTTTLSRDDLQRLRSISRNGLTTTLTPNPGGNYGLEVGLPDGTSVTDRSTAYGLLTSSKLEKPGVVTQEGSRQEDKSWKTTFQQQLGSLNGESIISSDGMPTSATGNASEPFDYATAPASIPDLGITGIRVTATYKTGGSDAGIAFTSYYDGAGRLRRSEEPSPNVGTAITRYDYKEGRLTSITDADGIKTLLGYENNDEPTTVATDLNGNGSIDPAIDRILKSVTQSNGNAIETTTSIYNNGSPRIVEQRTEYPASRYTEIVPDGNYNQKTSITEGTTGASETVDILTGPDGLLGSSKMTYQDGVISDVEWNSGFESEWPGISISGHFDSNNLGEFTKVTNAGVGAGSEVTLNPDTGLPTSAKIGPLQSTFSTSSISGGGIEQTVTSPQGSQTSKWNGKGDLVGSSGDNQTDFTLSAPTVSGGAVAQTLTVGGHQTQFQTNPAGGEPSRTFPDNHGEKVTFSAGGRLLTSTNARKQTTFFHRTNGVDVDQIYLPGGETVSVDTQQDGTIRSITDKSGTREFDYENGQLTNVRYTSGPLQGKIITYKRDEYGRFKGVAVNCGESVTFGYNGSQIVTVKDDTSGRSGKYYGETTASYLPRYFDYGPIFLERYYDSAGRISNLTYMTGPGQSNLEFSYGYDTTGKCNEVDVTGRGTWHIGYDGKGQLTTAEKRNGTQVEKSIEYPTSETGMPTGKTTDGVSTPFPGSGGGGLWQVLYRVNTKRSITVMGSATPTAIVMVNGLAQIVDSTGTFSCVLGNLGGAARWVGVTVQARLLEAGDGGRDAVQELTKYIWLPPEYETISYDPDGNRTRDGRFTHQYDSGNHYLGSTAKTAPPNAPLTNLKVVIERDSEGRRFRKQVYHGSQLQSEFLYLYDGLNLVWEQESDKDGQVKMVRTYAYSCDIFGRPGGTVGALIEVAETRNGLTTRSIPFHDGVGNIIAYKDASSGQVVAEFEYEPFGELISAKGPRVDSCLLRLAGKYCDPETGFYDFVGRTYDPTTRQWLTRDPAGEGADRNLYSYCKNNPIEFVDEDGRTALPTHGFWDGPFGGGKWWVAGAPFKDSTGQVKVRLEYVFVGWDGKKEDSFYDVSLSEARELVPGASLEMKEVRPRPTMLGNLKGFREPSFTDIGNYIKQHPGFRMQMAIYRGALFTVGFGGIANALRLPAWAMKSAGFLMTQKGLYDWSQTGYAVTPEMVGEMLGGGAVGRGFLAGRGSPFQRPVNSAATTKAAAMAKYAEIFGGCFVAGTMIPGEKGISEIQDIRIGDKVRTYDFASNTWILGDVVDTYQRRFEGEIVTLNIAGQIIEVTDNHPVWVVQGDSLEMRPPVRADLAAAERRGLGGGRWVEAGDILEGDQLRSLDGNEYVASVSRRFGRVTVHNFHVAKTHNYSVTSLGFLVHNSSMAPVPGSAAALRLAPAMEHIEDAASSLLARQRARQLAGLGDNSVPLISTVGPQKGWNLGRQSPDGIRGWRMDWDPDKGYHVNWWDHSGGAKRKEWLYGAIRIVDGTWDDYIELLKHAFGN